MWLSCGPYADCIQPRFAHLVPFNLSSSPSNQFQFCLASSLTVSCVGCLLLLFALTELCFLRVPAILSGLFLFFVFSKSYHTVLNNISEQHNTYACQTQHQKEKKVLYKDKCVGVDTQLVCVCVGGGNKSVKLG